MFLISSREHLYQWDVRDYCMIFMNEFVVNFFGCFPEGISS
jgi:hypothetical protein